MKVLTVVGARPQFVKAAPVNRALAAAGLEEVLVHTGQHFDDAMSDIFFRELEIATPKHNLGIGGGRHGEMTGAMLARLEEVMIAESPGWVMVYGDTNSTLAGALAAAKLHLPVAHVESGLRSYNRRMPEEINRLLTDQLSTLLFCPSQTAADNLRKEGVVEGVHVVGDVMADASELARGLVAEDRDRYVGEVNRPLFEESFLLLTLHRAENVDDEARLRRLVAALNRIRTNIVLPLHPRTRKALGTFGIELGAHIRVIDPVGYLEMTALLMGCEMVLTDSGGLQKEAYWAEKPCITMRMETEWVETVEHGWNRLLGAQTEDLPRIVENFVVPREHPNFGNERAADAIAGIIVDRKKN